MMIYSSYLTIINYYQTLTIYFLKKTFNPIASHDIPIKSHGIHRIYPNKSYIPSLWISIGYPISPLNHILVGAFNPSEKYESQLVLLFPRYGKLKKDPNHQPDISLTIMNHY